MKDNLFVKILKNGGLFSILIVVTFFYLFKNMDLKVVISTISTTNINYLLLAVLAMLVFLSGEAINFNRNLKVLGYKTSFLKCINYSMNGFFFSSITPSASGGQPMQVYRMYKDDIKFSHSTLVLFIEFIFFQAVTILYALIGFIAEYNLLSANINSLRYLFFLGILANAGMLIAIAMVLFNNKGLIKLMSKFTRFLSSIGFKKADKINEKVAGIVDEYKDCSAYIVSNKVVIVKTFLTKCVQILALHSVPYLVYRSFGFNEYSIFMFISIQSVLFITVSALPLPGAVGVSESGFLILYKLLFPDAVLSEAMLLSRGINFYLLVFLCGIFIFTKNIIDTKKASNIEEIETDDDVDVQSIEKISFEILKNKKKIKNTVATTVGTYKATLSSIALRKQILKEQKVRANL